jgi:ABC-type transport system involved in cytochrome c biogenesis permease subunit
VALLAALTLYFVFYAPAIAQGVMADVLPAKETLWLEIHIAAYWISYSLYFTGLLLAVIYFLRKATTRFPWIETAIVVATILAVIGLITGILFSKPAWNAWWVWDPKHTIVLLNTLVLAGICPFVALTRLFSKTIDRNMALMVLLFIAVALCTGSFLAGFMRNVHPQWFLNIFFSIVR